MLVSCAVIELVNVLTARKNGSLDKYASDCVNVLEVIDGWIFRFVDASEIWIGGSDITVYDGPDRKMLMQVSDRFWSQCANNSEKSIMTICS